MTHSLSISQLYIYPVKSLAGMAVERALLTPEGLRGDRQWMVVDPTGRFVTQRQLPLMATIKAAFTASGELLLRNCQGEQRTVPEPPARRSSPVLVGKDPCAGLVAAEDVNHWLTRSLHSEQPLRLVKFDIRQPRQTNAQRFGANTTLFADAAPYLIANLASLEALRSAFANEPAPMDMRRFRPNIVLSGVAAFQEHQLREIFSPEQTWRFRLCDPCQRCSIITVNPDSGERHPKGAPIRELASLNAMPDNPKAPAFGVNSILLSGAGQTLHVGAAVQGIFHPSTFPPGTSHPASAAS